LIAFEALLEVALNGLVNGKDPSQQKPSALMIMVLVGVHEPWLVVSFSWCEKSKTMVIVRQGNYVI